MENPYEETINAVNKAIKSIAGFSDLSIEQQAFLDILLSTRKALGVVHKLF